MTSKYETETAKLNRITRMLSTFEIARDLVDTFGGATVGEALSLVAEAEKLKPENHIHLVNVGEGAVADDYQNFVKQPAMKYHIRGGGKITLMKNKTPVSFNGKTIKRSWPSFEDVVDAPQKEFNKVVDESGELPWIKSMSRLHLSENAVAILKRAVARKQAIDKACREESAQRAVDNVKSRILQRHDLEEAIMNEYTSGQQYSPETQVQKIIDIPAIRLPDYYDTQKFMPAEFRPKIEKTKDNSFAAQAGRMKSPTPAGRSLDRPKPEFADTSRIEQGSLSVNRPSARPATNADEGRNTLPQYRGGKANNGQPQQFPRKPVATLAQTLNQEEVITDMLTEEYSEAKARVAEGQKKAEEQARKSENAWFTRSSTVKKEKPHIEISSGNGRNIAFVS